MLPKSAKAMHTVAGCYAVDDGPPATRPDRSVTTVSRQLRPDLPSDAEHDLELVLQASDAPGYNTAAVARRCGMPAATFQAWERRHGFPDAQAGTGQAAALLERDVRRSAGCKRASPRGSRSARRWHSCGRLSAHPGPGPGPRSGGRTSRPAASPGGSRALLAFDGARAGVTLGEAFGLYPVEQVCLEVIQPMLHGVGQDGTPARSTSPRSISRAGTFASGSPPCSTSATVPTGHGPPWPPVPPTTGTSSAS